MNEPQIYKFNGQEVRVIEKDGQPWWIAKDVCEVLELTDTNKALLGLDDDEKSEHEQYSGSGRKPLIINEPGLYSLILRSRKPEAKQFKRWITHEVLPTIRKTGGYVANDDLFIQTYLPHADEQTKAMFRITLESVRKANEQIAIMQPKAEYFDALVDRNLLTSFRDTAKELKVKEREFINWLLDRGYVFRDGKGALKPYAQHVPNLFELKEWERGNKAGTQTMVTPKGRETFRLLLTKQTA
ncbi:BRO family protein [Paenibacillus ihumii]|uniref:BRO family protein n=1 Tax=Paenibacillus ihumii TaxID=687436 RepID=UPI0006D7FF49|nr:BRO family protein [Paenibacillus ihumii]